MTMGNSRIMKKNVVYANKKRNKDNKRFRIQKIKRDKNSIIENEIKSDEEIVDMISQKASTNNLPQIPENSLEKRLKLAKKYINNIQKEEIDTIITENDIDPIAARLEEEILLKTGIKHQLLADNININNEIGENFVVKMKDSITCIVIGNEYFFVGSKDGNIYKYNKNNGKKIGIILGSKRNGIKKLKDGELSTICHGHILSLALSYDEKYLVSTCEDKYVYIWDPESLNHIHTFRGHRDWVSGAVFRLGTHQLYTTSYDRMVKIWNLDDMAYVGTLYGHEDKILSIDTLHKENALTAGGLDYSIRLFKIDKETQSLYQAENGYFQEYALMINEEEFISISSNGSLLLWKYNKRKPIGIVDHAHNGHDRTGNVFYYPSNSNKLSTLTNNTTDNICDDIISKPIYSIAVIPYSDLIATGSSDGYVHLWKYKIDENTNNSTINVQFEIKRSLYIKGIISCLKFSPCHKKLFIGISRDSRLGRWETIKTTNKIIIYNMN